VIRQGRRQYAHTASYPQRLGKILVALAEFGYLTAEQVTRLCYAPSSINFVRKKLKSLLASDFVLAVARHSVTLPRVYTLTGTGYTYAEALGMPQAKRVRPSEEEKKAGNLFFIQHTLAVTDVLISAKLLSRTVPGIVLHRLYLERELKRKIYVEIPMPIGEGRTHPRTICLEPDAAVDFLIQGKWQDFFHVEVYRSNLREYRFKQKIAGYVAYAGSTRHRALFHTPALSIAVFCQTDQLVETLKRWTEEVLEQVQQPELGERFYFCSLDVASASPQEIYLTPVWQQALRTAKTPLLVLDEEHNECYPSTEPAVTPAITNAFSE
jgi:hypothetical protein